MRTPVHSDGILTLDALAALAAARGLDFLWVTEHNTVSHHPHLDTIGARYGIRLLPGQEVTTADGHANAFGDVGWVDFRRPAATWAEHVAAAGGLLSVNHPVSGDCAWRTPGGARPLAPSMAEVWHSSWTDRADGAPLAWWDAVGRPVPIGGSDVHDPASVLPGAPTTWALCEDDDVLAAMAAGRTAVSAAPDAPVLLRVDGELVAVEAEGAQLVCPDGRRTPVRGPRATLDRPPGPACARTRPTDGCSACPLLTRGPDSTPTHPDATTGGPRCTTTARLIRGATAPEPCSALADAVWADPEPVALGPLGRAGRSR